MVEGKEGHGRKKEEKKKKNSVSDIYVSGV